MEESDGVGCLQEALRVEQLDTPSFSQFPPQYKQKHNQVKYLRKVLVGSRQYKLKQTHFGSNSLYKLSWFCWLYMNTDRLTIKYPGM